MASRILRNKKFADPTAGATSVVTLYTTPANQRARINKLTVLNSNATTARTLTVYLVPSGGTAADTNALIKDVSIGAKETLIVTEAIGHMLETGDFIQFLQDTGTDLIAHLSGTEYAI